MEHDDVCLPTPELIKRIVDQEARVAGSGIVRAVIQRCPDEVVAFYASSVLVVSSVSALVTGGTATHEEAYKFCDQLKEAIRLLCPKH